MRTHILETHSNENQKNNKTCTDSMLSFQRFSGLYRDVNSALRAADDHHAAALGHRRVQELAAGACELLTERGLSPPIAILIRLLFTDPGGSHPGTSGSQPACQPTTPPRGGGRRCFDPTRPKILPTEATPINKKVSKIFMGLRPLDPPTHPGTPPPGG